MVELLFYVGEEIEITERRVETIFDLISKVAGIPNLLMIIMTLLVSKYQELNSSLMILNKMGVKKIRYPNLVNTSFCLKAKLFIADSFPKVVKKCGSRSLEKATSQFGDLKDEIAKTFDLRAILNHTF